MTFSRATPNLYRWVAVSVLIHAALLFVPMRIFEAVFPRDRAQSYGLPRDLTPDFSEVAIAVVQMPQVPVVEAVDGPVEEIDDILFPRVASPAIPPTEGGGGGHPAAAPQYFPPRPRLIVPPHLDDLDISDVRISLRILVGINGRPEEVIISDSLENQEIRRRLMESARKFRFEPARRGDLPVASWIDLPLVLESSRRR
jgi:hypothetical protein